MADKPLCSVEGCGKPRYAKGYCRNHYYRWRQHGDPVAGRTPPGEPLEWLRQHVGHTGTTCLVWPFGRLPNGYGHVTYEGIVTHASRIMCLLAHGEPPQGEPFALHSCGGGSDGCVHPAHLRWGHQAANMLDSVVEGTRCRGEDQHAAKLTEADVRDIRASSARGVDLADRYGVVPDTIRRIRKREAWAWLD